MIKIEKTCDQDKKQLIKNWWKWLLFCIIGWLIIYGFLLNDWDFKRKCKANQYLESKWYEIENQNDTSYGFWMYTWGCYSDTIAPDTSLWICVNIERDTLNDSAIDTLVFVKNNNLSKYRYFRIKFK